MQSVLIRLPENQQDPAEWISLTAGGQQQGGSRKGSLSDAAQALAHRSVIVLAPTQTILLNQTLMPEGNRSKLRQAIPFAMEDKVAEDVENLHFALGKESKIANEEFKQLLQPVAVIRKSQIDSWNEQLKAINIAPAAIVPDALTLPLYESAWSLLLDNHIALVRTGQFSGFACDLENLNAILNSLLHKATDKPRSLYIRAYQELPENFKIENSYFVDAVESRSENETAINKDNEPSLVSLAASKDTENTQIAIYFEPVNTELLSVLATGYLKTPHINLLQGKYKAQEQYGSLVKTWRLPAILLASWIAILLLSTGVELFQLSKKNKEFESQIKQIFKATLPAGRDNYNLREQMEQHLAILETQSSSEGGGFMYMLKIAGDKIQQTPGITIQTVSFSKNQMDIDLTLSDVQILDKLKSSFDQELDIKADIQSASTEGDEVKGRLRLSKR